MKYHVNPDLGEPRVCRASKKPCPYGTPAEHFSSPEDARAAYEAVQEGRLRPALSSLLSPRGSSLEAGDLKELVREAYEESRAWREVASKLTPDGLTYGVRWYVMCGFETINAHLRGLDHDPYGKPLDPEVLKMAHPRIRELDEAIAVAPQKDRRLYRYASIPGLSSREAIEKIESEGLLHQPAYVSASTSHALPLYKILDKPEERFLIEIAARGGAPLQEEDEPRAGDIQSVETEILLPRGQSFEVAGVEWRKKAFLGDLKDYLLPAWHRDSPAERKIRRIESISLPVLKLVHVPE